MSDRSNPSRWDSDGELIALGGNGSGSTFGAEIQVVSATKHAEVARLVGHTGEVYANGFHAGSMSSSFRWL